MVRGVLLSGALALLCACSNDDSDARSFTVTVESVEVSSGTDAGTVEVEGLPAEGRTLVVDPEG